MSYATVNILAPKNNCSTFYVLVADYARNSLDLTPAELPCNSSGKFSRNVQPTELEGLGKSSTA